MATVGKQVSEGAARRTAGHAVACSQPPRHRDAGPAGWRWLLRQAAVTPAQGRHGDVTGFSVRRERTGPAPPVSPLGYESEGRTSLGSGCEMGGRSRGDSRPPNYCETLTFSFSAKNKRIDSPALCLFESPGLQNNPESRCSQRRKNASMLIFKRENIKSAAAGCHKADVPLSSGTAGSI